MIAMEEKNTIEKIVITLQTKKAAELLKKDLVEAGVVKSDIRLKTNSKNGCCSLTMSVKENADNIRKMISMFMGEGYDLSIPEIEKILKLKITI